MNPIRLFSNPKAMANEIARCFHQQVKQAENDQRIFSIVFSGGNSVKTLYPTLADTQWKESIPWESVHIFFADERCVSPDNDESNYKILFDHLINHISIPDTNIHRIRGEENPQKESLRYAEDIKNHLAVRKDSKNYFDWVLLGVGTDGHTASLFPNQHVINSSKLCEVAQHPDTGQTRITMTPAAINLSSRITYHCFGEGKSQIVSKLVSDPSATNKYPALRVKGEWFLDQEAASRINPLDIEKE